jgi:Phosphotransferase enzyme family
MTISSPPLPELTALCRERFGRELLSAERIGEGRNSRVFRVVVTGHASGETEPLVVKCYRRVPGDARDRLAIEFGGLQFLWQNGVRAIPQALAADRERYCAIYEYLDGDVPDILAVTAHDIEASVRFLSELKALCGRAGSMALPAASEACFSIEAVALSVADRVHRLQESDRGGDGELLHRWLAATFEPLRADVLAWCRKTAATTGMAYDGELVPWRRTLSPSDFGFHNSIRRRNGSLAFVDFEYFGWDDPAKTLVDFVLHPGMMLPDNLARTFANTFLSAFADDEQLADRARIVYPLFGLKWCTIVLNDFLPERVTAAQAAETDARETRLRQLASAEAMAARIAREYRDNPLFDRP